MTSGTSRDVFLAVLRNGPKFVPPERTSDGTPRYVRTVIRIVAPDECGTYEPITMHDNAYEDDKSAYSAAVSLAQKFHFCGVHATYMIRPQLVYVN